MTDDFVTFGGHSLLAARAVIRLQQALGASVGIELLLSSATVERIAAVLENALAGGGERAAPPIPRAPADALAPSFAQERLWFLSQLEPELLAYNIVFTVRLQGTLKRRALELALSELVARHDSLRMAFPAVDGRATVRVNPPAPLEMPLVALSGDHRDKATELSRLEREEAKRPFDLERGPLLRVKLVRLARTDYALIVGVHHIVADGWSVRLFVDELCQRHAQHAASDGDDGSPPAPLPLAYVDVAAWERASSARNGESTRGGADAVSSRCAGLARAAHRPPRPPVRSSHGGWVKFALSAALRAQLEAWSQAHRVTPFATLFAAWAALLTRYSRQEDLLIGTPVANRTRSEVEGLIGFFADTAVLRAQPSGGKSFATLVKEVQAAAARFAHAQVPLQRVVDALGVARDPSRTPLFQSMFVLQNVPAPAARSGELTIDVRYTRPPASKFDLTLEIEPANEGFVGVLEDAPMTCMKRRRRGAWRSTSRCCCATPCRCPSSRSVRCRS